MKNKDHHIINELQTSFFSKGGRMPDEFNDLIKAFKDVYEDIKSSENRLPSNGVLYYVSEKLKESNYFNCERIVVNQNKNYCSKNKLELEIDLPNYTGKKKAFNPDIMSKDKKIIVEVEAGQAVDNYRFLKDLFESIIYTKCEYLAIAVRNIYSVYSKKKDKVTSSQYDYEVICDFMEWLFCSRVKVPLKGILIIGY